MTQNELAALKDSIDRAFDGFYERLFKRPRKFYVVRTDDSTKYVSPFCVSQGDRSLFVEATEREYNLFKLSHGEFYDKDEVCPGDCICDMGEDGPKYWKFDPEARGAKVEFIIPSVVYATVAEFKEKYYGA